MKITPPSGVVSFLFTDIEGSTRRWDTDAEAMRTALASHDAVLRESVEKYEGWLFKHTGDGVCVAFASPRSAVDTAVAAQRALELPVRMGIATGEAELRGDDYFGAVLNRAARVMAAGHGGQILVDGTTAGLLSGIDLTPLGPKRLRDIARVVEIHQVRAPGLRAEFPALKSVDAAAGNLKPPTTSFVGRESELAALQNLLRAHRLVTLTGVGGVGKTRLATELGARSTNAFPDGVYLIELAAVGDPAAVPDVAAAALGITQRPGMTVSGSIAAALEGRVRLLIFDNCEHVLDAAADVIELVLAQSDTVTILATSREGLRLADEHLWPVSSLDVGSSAAALFVDRASAVASVVSSAPDVEAVAEICKRLDGIPLAIELAASRMQSMTAAELRDRLDDRFRLLVGARRGLERHQTLRHAVQWSFDLLTEAEKQVLTRCSTFAGGFDLASATAVCRLDDELTTLDLLDSLVRKSLLVADRGSIHTRFTMLETIRQFTEEQLVASGGAEEVRTDHARHFATRITDAMAAWDGPRQREVFEWFSAELSNLRAAFRWAADTGDLDAASAISVLSAFLGYFVVQWEPVGWAEELLPQAESIRHRSLAQLYVAASYCAAVGRLDEFRHYAAASRTAIESGEFDDVREELATALAAGFNTIGQPDLAVEWCQSIIERTSGDHLANRSVQVIALALAGATDESLRMADELLYEVQRTDNPAFASAGLLAHGWSRRNVDPAGAYHSLRRAWTIAVEGGNRQQASATTLLMSGLAAAEGNRAEALDAIADTIHQYYDSGTIELLLNAYGVLATVLDAVGYYESAAVVSGFAARGRAISAFPEVGDTNAHLRTVLGEERFEALAAKGPAMTYAEMAAYAIDQIDWARAKLKETAAT
ncbi:putative ATPase [Mycolicibacterium rhodesiae NBB3]|jgi:predicted ATPase|uniref:Putative ATPase n=1 Tax=Mycolicibacterium rhodesiae (strain NBB3) TaxID=710685 RepID=G8RHZ4_MYCRN|nr:adenylate/guanylate cyclase domain-containing protein [Mycolicibacterium rhodesiae]AEV72144.1 putative ATPase [Mycolicibacterium rhodesiae NBB3]